MRLDGLLPAMSSVLVLVVVAGAIAYRVLTPEERQQVLQRVRRILSEIRQWVAESEPARAGLRTRRRYLVVTPILIVINAGVFGAALFNGAATEREQLIAWGATEVTRTANGEWWRMITAMFVHASALELIVILIAVVQVASLLERLTGPLTVAGVYVAAGALGHAVGMADTAAAVHSGGTPAVFGLYGLLLAAWGWHMLRRADPRLPMAMFKLLAPGAALLLLSSVVNGSLASQRTPAAFAVGFCIGMVATIRPERTRPRLALTSAAVAVVIVMTANVLTPLHASVDVRSHLSLVVALEERTADEYQKTLNRFTARNKPLDAAVLTALIEETILPEFRKAANALAALNGGPDGEPAVASARQYLRLRARSWQLRAEGLRKRNLRILQDAEQVERLAKDALTHASKSASAAGFGASGGVPRPQSTATNPHVHFG